MANAALWGKRVRITVITNTVKYCNVQYFTVKCGILQYAVFGVPNVALTAMMLQ